MAKKLKKKKVNTRIRKTIRKTSAAVLMVAAIAVAAIPAENIGAAGGGTGATTTLTGREYEDTRDAYTYGVYDDRTEGAGSGAVDGEPDSKSKPGVYYTAVNSVTGLATHHRHKNDSCDCQKSYAIRLSSDNNYILSWQFLYNSGYLYGYNDEFRVPDDQVLKVPYQINSDYVYLTENEYNAFWNLVLGARPSDEADAEQKKWDSYKAEFDSYKFGWTDWYATKGNLDDNDPINKVLREFMPAKWTSYIQDCANAYNQYQADLEAWKADETATEETKPILDNYTTEVKNDQVLLDPQKISGDDLKYRFFCEFYQEKVPATVGKKISSMQTNYGTYTLQPAFNDDNERIYLIRAIVPGQVHAFYSIDGYNFLMSPTEQQSIKYIGDYAFAGVKNVKKLELPTEITAIGDYAFANSFLESIYLGNVKVIGNASFKGCAKLHDVDFSITNISHIGAEAFAGTNLEKVVMPTNIEQIDAGAFYNCKNLKSVDFTTIQTPGGCEIGEAAFYDCSDLTSLNFEAGKQNIIKSLGKACFGVSLGDDDALDVALPNYLKVLPEHLFTGRRHLKAVTFPMFVTTIPETVFYHCNNLETVVFPDTINGYSQSANAPFKNLIFLDVTNKNLKVYGPGMVDGEKAKPRTSTWECFTMVNDFVPYIYVEDGITYYEVCEGDYILNANEKGELVSCEPVHELTKDVDLIIPEKVGEYRITSIKDGAFSNKNLRSHIRKIIIADGTVENIPAHVFEDLPKLREVVLGDSVNNIGDSAFAKCANLEDVTFRNENNVAIGSNAFATLGDKLTFHGVIRADYGPFVWAMQEDNYVNSNRVRVCYKQNEPYCLTVILNDAITEQNPTGKPMPTVVDYPKFEQLDEIYNDYAIEEIYNSYSLEKYDYLRNQFYSLWVNAGDDDAREGLYQTDAYGPWINVSFCAQFHDYLQAKAETKPVMEKTTVLEQLTATLLQPLVVNAAEADPIPTPKPYFVTYNYSIRNKIKNIEDGTADVTKPWESELTSSEMRWLDACQNIIIPAGVKSIDAKSYFSDATKNGPSITRYFKGFLPDDVYNMYTKEIAEISSDDKSVPGLFSGYLKDGYKKANETDILEDKVKGNDRVESITLTDVEYLPDYAFDSCERLTRVVLGEAMNDLGALPFRDCRSLTDIVGNNRYSAVDGLVIDNQPNASGGTTIVECVPSRGTTKGGSSIIPDALNDAEMQALKNVSEISPEAFKDCDLIDEVDLSSTSVAVIPAECFMGCDELDTLILPLSTVEIMDKAVDTESKSLDVYIPAGEVQIKNDAFKHSSDVTFYTGEDTAAYRYAKEYGITVKASNVYKVEFCDYDGRNLVEPFYVNSGEMVLVPDDPTDPASKQHIYGNGKLDSEIPKRNGYEFVEWASNNDAFDYPGPIVGNVVFSARYKAVEGTHDGKYYIDVVDGLTGEKIQRLEVDPDSDATKLLPAAPVHDGFTFFAWSSEDYKKVTGDIILTALYTPTSVDDGKYQVDFVDGITGQIFNTIRVDFATNVGKMLPTPPTHDGYTFYSWSNSDDYVNVQKDMIVTALYQPTGVNDGKFNLTFIDGLTGAVLKYVRVDFGSDAEPQLPTPPKHDGYTFQRWSNIDYKNVRKDTTVTALYTANSSNNNNNNNSEKKEENPNSNNNSSNNSTTAKKYKVTVENGSGTGEYAEGATVAIAANAPAAGQVFSKWTTESKGVNLTNATISATTFKMPANDVTVKAEYVASAAETTAVAPTTTTSAYPPGYGDGYGTTDNQKPKEEENNAQVTVSKPGISNIDLATAKVNGSSDSFIIKVTETNEAEEQVRNALTNRYGSIDNRIDYWSCDISLYDETGNTKITDTTGLTVDITLPIPDSLRQYGGNNMVGAVADGSLESLTPRFNEINGVPCVTFTATHFSPYTIYVDKENLVASQMMDATPKTGDPIHPKWFLSIGLACVSVLLFMKKDKKSKKILKTA